MRRMYSFELICGIFNISGVFLFIVHKYLEILSKFGATFVGGRDIDHRAS